MNDMTTQFTESTVELKNTRSGIARTAEVIRAPNFVWFVCATRSVYVDATGWHRDNGRGEAVGGEHGERRALAALARLV